MKLKKFLLSVVLLLIVAALSITGTAEKGFAAPELYGGSLDGVVFTIDTEDASRNLIEYLDC